MNCPTKLRKICLWICEVWCSCVQCNWQNPLKIQPSPFQGVSGNSLGLPFFPINWTAWTQNNANASVLLFKHFLVQYLCPQSVKTSLKRKSAEFYDELLVQTGNTGSWPSWKVTWKFVLLNCQVIKNQGAPNCWRELSEFYVFEVFCCLMWKTSFQQPNDPCTEKCDASFTFH